MAKNKKTETPTVDDKILFDTMPGSDAKTEEDVKGFEVDMNFDIPDDSDEIEFPKEEEIEEVQELTAEEESSEISEEETEEEVLEATDESQEATGEETILAEDEGDTQQPEGTIPEAVAESKEPMIPKSRFDEVLAKQKALAKKLEEATNPQEVYAETEYDFNAKELEYQEHILNGEPTKAADLRSEIRNAERNQMMFEVQNKMGQTVQQSTEMSALQTKAAELATSFPVLDEGHATFDQVKTQEVLDLRDAFMVQGFTGADALDKAAKYVMGSPAPVVKTNPEKQKIAQRQQTANTNKKLEAAESQPPTMKTGKQKVEKKVDLSLLSSDEFEALPDETLRRMRGDFG